MVTRVEWTVETCSCKWLVKNYVHYARWLLLF